SSIGKTFKYDNKTLYKVTGILKNTPPNTDFPLAVVVPYSALENTYIKNNLTDWVSTFEGAYTFVVLPPELSPSKLDAQLKGFAKKHKPSEYSKDGYVTQPLSEIHFDDRFGNFNDHTFSHSLIRALAFIGLFLILIACVNFINLATAQAVNRSKEVGVRKVLGSNRKQLATQFLSETAVITITALIISVAIAYFTLPFLNQLLHVKMQMILNGSIVVYLLAVLIVVTFLSGLYPAMIVSVFNPITAVKIKISAKMAGGLSLRRVFVV